MKKVVSLAAVLCAAAVAAAALVRRAARWGSTADERAMPLPGDAYLGDDPGTRTVMTRAVSISVPPEVVWPWLAQMGRGAGWYSHDRLDNGGKRSARHIVSWIPSPRIGDASAIGWLREMESGRALTWWMPGERLLGTTMRMVSDIRLGRDGTGSRLVIRMSADASGPAGAVAMRVFEAVDSIMAIRQLRGIRTRAEAFGTRTADPDVPESGERDQFQLYETIWASGGGAGVAGREKAALWRRDAEAAGVVTP